MGLLDLIGLFAAQPNPILVHIQDVGFIQL